MQRLSASEHAERVRVLAAPVVALLSASLAMCCLVTVPAAVMSWPVLEGLDPASTAWCALAAGLAVGVALVSVLGGRWFGAAPSLAIGSVAAVAGQLLAHDVDAGGQLVLGLLSLGTAVGALTGGGISLVQEVPAHAAAPTIAGWVLPWAAGWGLLGWGVLRAHDPSSTTIGGGPPSVAVAVVAAVVLAWALATMALEPDRTWSGSTLGWENAWAGLAILTASAVSLAMLVGTQVHVAASWGRPVALLTTGAAVCGLLMCARLAPVQSLRPCLVAICAAGLTGPGCLHLMTFVAWHRPDPPPVWLAVALAAAGLVGAGVGWRYPAHGVGGGLTLMALAAGAGWVLPSSWGLLALVGCPFAVGLAVAVASAVRLVAPHSMGLRFLAVSALTAVMIGLVSAMPLAWALGAGLTGPEASSRAGARVLLGLSFAALVLSSAVVTVMLRRVGQPRPRLAPPLTCNTWPVVNPERGDAR